ncbi:DNA polymerase sliding clamp [Halolamina salifodinae]|uniref:DNA polymerase sliding clamp n=1 Tax=Halolamina salifodinae TaxID=1202767 RepID=A0A8T4GTJ8_9EURY|nr:DNA polymerase sliding clamp [Halolamina salifodinae]MBP1986337.1 proliferating cell nuclear antigen [Halolamina salifodinae]
MPEAVSPTVSLPQDPAVDAAIDADRLDESLAVVGALVDECRMELAPEALRVRAVDPASVAAVSLDLPAEAFERYEAGGETVGIDVERLAAVVSLADPGDLVRLVLDAERRRLHVLVGELAYTLGLIDPEAIREPLDPAEMNYDCPASLTLEGRDVSRFVDAADMVSTHVRLGIDAGAETFYVEASGDTDDVALAFPGEDLAALSPADAESLFSLDYLRELARPIPVGSEVAMELGTEQPVTLSFAVADGTGTATFLLSPRRAVA